MKNLRRILALTAFGVLASGLASADTISYLYNVANHATTFNATVGLQDFDPTLGTLTGIEIDTTASFLLNLKVSNNSGIPDGDTAQTEAYTNAFATGNALITGPGSLLIHLSATSAAQADAALAAGTFDLYSGLPATNSATANPVDLADYTGPAGTVTFTNLNFHGGGLSAGGETNDNDIFFNVTGSASGSVHVIYTYTAAVSATPEPGTYLLMGTALIGFGIRRRFKA